MSESNQKVMEIIERQCLYCNKTLKGRTDKKFCDDFCRNSYNNEQNSDANNFVRNINNILRKNRRILKSCISESFETGRIKKIQLTEKGFLFPYHTHSFENKNGQVYTFCYEYGFLPLDEEWLLVVKRKENK